MRILVADEDRGQFPVLAAIIASLGHELVATEVRAGEVARVTALVHPDVALVLLGDSSRRALDLISDLVNEAECPVIVLLPESDIAFVSEAAKRGVFAYLVETDAEALESALEIVLLRFAEYHGLAGAFGRRAVTERAKGVLMERHGIDEAEAFERLRSHARHTDRKLVDVAHDLLEGGRIPYRV